MNNDYVEIDYNNDDDNFVDDLINFTNTMFPDVHEITLFVKYHDNDKNKYTIRFNYRDMFNDKHETFYDYTFINRVLKMLNVIYDKMIELNHDFVLYDKCVYLRINNNAIVESFNTHYFVIDESRVAWVNELQNYDCVIA